MVAAATRRLHHPQRLRRLRYVGRVPKRALHVRPVSLALLFTGDLRRLAPRLVRSEALVVAGVRAVFAGADHPAVSGAIPVHLLLLPRRLLQGVLGGPVELRRRRAAQQLPRRAVLPAHSPKRSPVLPLHRGAVPVLPVARRMEGTLVQRRRGRNEVRHRCRDARVGAEHDAARLLHARLSLDATRRRRIPRQSVEASRAQSSLRLLELPESLAHEVGVDEPLRRRLRGCVRSPVLDGDLARLEDLVSTEYETIEHDVLVIGAGGAGLRAAIEAAAQGVRVGLVCKSLLGKAHTVMAEGGMAAAMANVDDRDNWRVHFADTMRGGQYLNNWRMAELHAKEAPERVKELEAWGALFDRTPDGRILQRNFGGHRYPRLAHVGDRTGLEMIRTLQDHGVHQGIDVHMEVTALTLLKDGDRVSGALTYDRERGWFRLFKAKAIVLGTGGVGRAFKITSNSWEYTGDGQSLAYNAGAALQDMEFVQFHPTGMIWPPSVRGILVTEGVRGEGGVLKNRDGKRFMFENIPDNYKSQTADTPEEGWK